MSKHFADRLIHALKARNTPACVGFDPLYDRLPEPLRALHGAAPSPAQTAAAITAFGKRVFELVAPLVGVVKINIAFFEPLRAVGFEAYFELIESARRAGLIVIGDVKRGDIGHSSAAYAVAQLADGESPGPDAVTVSGYLGIDGVQPFLDVARERNKGVFVLVHTSNASAGQLQHLTTPDGLEVAEHLAGLVNDWAHREGMVGDSGFSNVGAVVAPGDVDRARRLRARMPDSIFLVPGFGAQGRSVEQVAACFKPGGAGAIVNASRSVLYAFEDARLLARSNGDWAQCVEQACSDFVEALRAIGS
jgi:orotidine-5'-phosphate decarboxylase